MSKSGFILFCLSLTLFSFGLIMVYNTTSAEVLDKSLDVSMHSAVIKQLLYGIIGFFIGFFIYKKGAERLLNFSFPLFILLIVLLALVFIPKIGHEINGAKRWISLFGISFQPSEFAKIIFPLFFIHEIGKKEVSFSFFIKTLSFFFVPMILIFLQPDNGTCFILFVMMTILFFLTRIPWKYWALPLMICAFFGVIFAAKMPHVHDRIRVYFHPESDLLGKGHQPHQAKIAAGSGRLFGRGLGESLQKLNYLPEARSDYIGAIFAEEFGFLGISLLIVIYLFILIFGFSIAFNALNLNQFYLASSMTFIIIFQAFLNLGIVSGLLPSKGTTLPFFSQGGTALVVNIIAMSLLFSCCREERKDG